jgi:hypothetical protein
MDSCYHCNKDYSTPSVVSDWSQLEGCDYCSEECCEASEKLEKEMLVQLGEDLADYQD